MSDKKKDPWGLCPECGALVDTRKEHSCKKFVTKTTEKKEEFGTGSVRGERSGKGRFDLIPALPMKRLAQLYERGAAEYGDRNWEKGQPLSRFLDSAKRHVNDYELGDRSEDHLVAAIWNLCGFVWTEAEIEAGRLPEELKK